MNCRRLKRSSSMWSTRSPTTQPIWTTVSKPACWISSVASGSAVLRRRIRGRGAQVSAGQRKLKINEALKNILDHLATDLIENTRREVADNGVQTVDDIRRQKTRLARFSPDVAEQSASLKRFLSAHLYSQSRHFRRSRPFGCRARFALPILHGKSRSHAQVLLRPRQN